MTCKVVSLAFILVKCITKRNRLKMLLQLGTIIIWFLQTRSPYSQEVCRICKSDTLLSEVGQTENRLKANFRSMFRNVCPGYRFSLRYCCCALKTKAFSIPDRTVNWTANIICIVRFIDLLTRFQGLLLYFGRRTSSFVEMKFARIELKECMNLYSNWKPMNTIQGESNRCIISCWD